MLNLSNISSISIPIVAAILGIAMPIIVQTIAGIDTKYGSLRLLKRFKRERLYRHLWVSLTVALIALLIDHLVANDFLLTNLSCHIPSTDIKLPLTLYQNLTGGVVLISTVYLITVLFLVINLMIKYFDYQSLFEMVMNGVNRAREEHKEEVVQDLTELVKYCIYKNDDKTIERYYQFMLDYVSNANDNDKVGETGVEYEKWFYDNIIYINNIICREQEKPIATVYNNMFLQLLIPPNPNTIISDKTYEVLWSALKDQIRYGKLDIVFSLWVNLYYYSKSTLRPISKRYNDLGTFEVSNQYEINMRNKQIENLKEFHYALGGYLMFIRDYDFIADMFNHTNDDFTRSYLLPSLFYDILEDYKRMYSLSDDMLIRFQSKYSYYSSRTTEFSLVWAKKFLILLLFRIHRDDIFYRNHFIQDPWRYHLPDDIRQVMVLKRVVEEIKTQILYIDSKLIDVIIKKSEMFNTETKSIDLKNDVEAKLNSFISQIDSTITELKSNLELDNNKKVDFDNTTFDIINENRYVYESVLLKYDEGEVSDMNTRVINVSLSNKFSKESFSEKSTKYIYGQNEVMAQGMMCDFNHLYSFFYYDNKKRYYTIDSDSIFKAIERMVGGKESEYIAINFGYYLDYYTKEGSRRENELEKYSDNKFIYKSKLDIHSLPSPGNELMDFTIVLIKKEDLPYYVNVEAPKETIELFKLEKIEKEDNDLKIYTSILFKDFPVEKKYLENSEFCLVTIYYCIRLYWKKDADITILKTISQYRDSGVGMSINKLPKL